MHREDICSPSLIYLRPISGFHLNAPSCAVSASISRNWANLPQVILNMCLWRAVTYLRAKQLFLFIYFLLFFFYLKLPLNKWESLEQISHCFPFVRVKYAFQKPVSVKSRLRTDHCFYQCKWERNNNSPIFSNPEKTIVLSQSAVCNLLCFF